LAIRIRCLGCHRWPRFGSPAGGASKRAGTSSPSKQAYPKSHPVDPCMEPRCSRVAETRKLWPAEPPSQPKPAAEVRFFRLPRPRGGSSPGRLPPCGSLDRPEGEMAITCSVRAWSAKSESKAFDNAFLVDGTPWYLLGHGPLYSQDWNGPAPTGGCRGPESGIRARAWQALAADEMRGVSMSHSGFMATDEDELANAQEDSKLLVCAGNDVE